MKRLYEILQQIQSTHFAKLWLFYRKHFNSDEDCLQFLYDAILFNPSSTTSLPNLAQRLNQMATSECEPDKAHSIPLKMLNTVQRLVSAAHDMEQIRRGKDVFKVIYLVTCAETLLILFDEKNRKTSKRWLWLRFWNKNVSNKDKQYIQSKFSRDCLSEISESELKSQFFEKKSQELYDAVIKIKRANKKEANAQESEFEPPLEDHSDTFELFLNVMNEVRNSAIHDGAYWEHFFNNHGEEPLQFQLMIDLDKFSPKPGNKQLHWFLTELSYQEFENIFVRTSIRLIRNYLKQHTNQQEEPSHADA